LQQQILADSVVEQRWQLADFLTAPFMSWAEADFVGFGRQNFMAQAVLWGGRFNTGGGGVLLLLLLTHKGFCSSKFWRIWWWSNAGNWRRLCPGPRRISLDLATRDFYGTDRLVEVYSIRGRRRVLALPLSTGELSGGFVFRLGPRRSGSGE
jgi:hypothetical protein